MPMPPQLARAMRAKRRSRSQPRQVLDEELPAIDARWLARRNLFPRDHSTHRYSLDFLSPVIRWLTLSPRCAEFVLTNGTTQLVGITWLRVGGMCQSARAAFECPNCGHSCFKLFYYQGRFSGCYRCIGVPYASQQRSTENRPRLQAARLRLFLSSLPDNTETPAKPAICPGEYMPASSIACRSSRQASHVAKSRLHGSSVTKYYAHSQRMTQSAMRSTRACTMKSPFRAKPVFESIDLDQNRLLDRKVIITKAGRDRE
jgi:hypothetical protein